MKHVFIISILAAILFAFPNIAHSRQSQPPNDAAFQNEAVDEFQAIAEEADKAYIEDMSESPSGRFLLWQADFERRSWEWHLLSTKIIFVVVLLVVFFGLWVAWLQFRTDIASSLIKKRETSDDSGYDINASLQSVSVKSKTIGAVVLVFSGVFFFLYLSIVYPMSSLVAPDGHPAVTHQKQ